MWKAAMDFVSNVFVPATNLIDELVTSDEERLKLKNVLVGLQNEVTLKQMDLLAKNVELESQLINAQTGIITAEASSESALARNWRPITMLTFVGIIVLHALGLITLEPEFALQFTQLVQYGLTGYVVGRSAEKVAPAIAKAIKK